MTNEEAIAIGTERFLSNNQDKVMKAIEKGATDAALVVAESVGIQISARVAKFLADNKTDFISAIAAQVAIGAVSRRIQEERTDTEQSIFSRKNEPVTGE